MGFDSIYSIAHDAYDDVYLFQSIDDYNDNQNPQKWNGADYQFCLSYYGIF